jgi:hypothetical protein
MLKAGSDAFLALCSVGGVDLGDWLAPDDADFAGRLREWLKTLRKKNASVIFATAIPRQFPPKQLATSASSSAAALVDLIGPLT